MPVTLPVTPSSMNYASAVFAGFAVISIAWYFIHARKAFKGPPVTAEEVGVVSGKAVVDPENASGDVLSSTVEPKKTFLGE